MKDPGFLGFQLFQPQLGGCRTRLSRLWPVQRFQKPRRLDLGGVKQLVRIGDGFMMVYDDF